MKTSPPSAEVNNFMFKSKIKIISFKLALSVIKS